MTRQRILRIGFGFLWAILAAEFFLRLLSPVPMLPRYVQSTPYGIRGNMPSMEYSHSTPDYRIQLRTNAQGMRSSHDVAFEKPEGTRRIVMLGDSFGMGFGATTEQTFLSQLEQKLEAAGRPVQTLNLCVSGHGNAEQLIELKERGLKFAPDIVLLAWHHSDLNDNVRSGLFKLDDDDQLTRANASYLPGTQVAERLFKNKAYRWLAGNCQLYTWSREKASNLAQRAMVSLQPARPSRKTRRDAPLDATQATRGTNYRDRLSIALLKEMKRVTKESGAEFLIAIVPRRYNRTIFKTDFPIENLNKQNEFNIVNPMDKFGDHRGELIYWERSHFHFTPLGNRLVGESLAEFILENHWLDEAGN